MEERLPKTIDVRLRDLQAFLTYYVKKEHPGLEYIEEQLRNIRTALKEFREANKIRSAQDIQANEKVEKDLTTVGKDARWLLMELKALGMSIPETY